MLPRAILDLDTPALLLDHQQLHHNINRLKTKFAALNLPFRPHLKTTKCIEIARLVLADSEPKITVSTLKEAEFFAQAGIKDIIYPAKLSAPAPARRLFTVNALMVLRNFAQACICFTIYFKPISACANFLKLP